MAEKHVLTAVEESCKGGSRKRYYTKMDETGYKEHIISILLKTLMEDFSETRKVMKKLLSE